jgi:hypothetical protein
MRAKKTLAGLYLLLFFVGQLVGWSATNGVSTRASPVVPRLFIYYDGGLVFRYGDKKHSSIEDCVRSLKGMGVDAVSLDFRTKMKPDRILAISNAVSKASIKVRDILTVSGMSGRSHAD